MLLIHDGRLVTANARKAGLTEEDVLQGIRKRGYQSLDEVRFAMLEMDGEVSVIPREESSQA